MTPGRRIQLALTALALALGFGGCFCADECEIGRQRCVDGATMRRCDLAGPDQLTPVSPQDFTCFAPSSACAELPGDEAACVLPERLACGADYEAHCDGTRVLFCAYGAEGAEGLVAAIECADGDRTGRCGDAPDQPGTAVCL